MPDTGAPWNLPYPGQQDPPNGPAQLQALAAAVDTALDQVESKLPTHKLDSGTASATFSASALTQIPHGLGVKPTGAMLTYVENADALGGYVVNPVDPAGWTSTYVLAAAFTPAGARFAGVLSGVTHLVWS